MGHFPQSSGYPVTQDFARNFRIADNPRAVSQGARHRSCEWTQQRAGSALIRSEILRTPDRLIPDDHRDDGPAASDTYGPTL